MKVFLTRSAEQLAERVSEGLWNAYLSRGAKQKLNLASALDTGLCLSIGNQASVFHREVTG
jgi:hypothetical protein